MVAFSCNQERTNEGSEGQGGCSAQAGVFQGHGGRWDGELLTLEFTCTHPAGLSSWPGAGLQEPGEASGQPRWNWRDVLCRRD